MLSLGRFSHNVSRFAGDYSCNKTISRINLRLSMRQYSNATKYIEIDEKGELKLKLDPKVTALESELIYCDYIEKKKLKFGYQKNKAIENALKLKAKAERINKLMNEPTYSIALKYLKNEKNCQEKVAADADADANREENENKEPPTVSTVYKPYASIDKFENIDNEIIEKDTKMDDLSLNKQYKDLYDTYLRTKKSANFENKHKEGSIKDLETRILEMEMKRPNDGLSNVPANWMTDYEQYNDADENESWESHYGTQNSKIPVSKVPCGGCGALLHCQDSAIPGYLPSELFIGLKIEQLKSTICQRCHFMKSYDTTLEVKVSPEVYPEILKKIEFQKKKVAVILMIDLTDFPCSIWPNLPSIIGKNTNIFVVGNKVDLLPTDGPKFLSNVKESLMQALEISGIRKFNIKHVELISAKTGYGVERLINKLHKIWAYKGDVYMIGCTNVGKSTLFNTLLQSDYCKVQAVDLIQRATTSPWPGTTLNLLKFPILNPVRWRLYLRTLRQISEQDDIRAEMKFKKRQVTAERDITFATLQERIGRTFTPSSMQGLALIAYENRASSGIQFGIDENNPEYIKSKWCFDTPGVIHPDQILHLLTTEELLLTLPKKIISPRSFIFKPGQTLFLAGLGRLDLLDGPEFIRITVFASDRLPITICPTIEAEKIYNEFLQTDALVVPINLPDRLKTWPQLESKDFKLTGISEKKSVADILLSSAGWISLTPRENETVTLKAWTPEGRGIYQRTPALLAESITHRGPRIKSSSAYRCGRQIYNRP